MVWYAQSERAEDEVDGGSARVESYDENKNEHVEHWINVVDWTVYGAYCTQRVSMHYDVQHK